MAVNLCAVPLAARQAPETGCLPCKLSICFLLALIGAIQERHDLRARAVRVGAERRVGSTVRHVIRNRPANRISVERVGLHVGEVRAAARGALEGTVQERHALAARAGRIGRECRLGHAVRDAVLNGPGNRLGIVSARGNIREAACGLRLGAAGGAPQERHDLRTRAGLLGSEQVIAHAGGDAVLDRPLDSLIEVRAVGHVVEEVQDAVVFHEGRLDLDLAGGHGEGVLAIALVLERQLIAVLVGDGQGLEDVAAVGLDGDGHGVALAGALRADGHAAVLGLVHGDGVGRGRAAAGVVAGLHIGDRTGQLKGAELGDRKTQRSCRYPR